MSSDNGQRARDGSRGGLRRRAPLTLGLQRVVGVRVLFTDEGAVGEAIGVLHRRPVVQRIPLGQAAALVARGAPLAVRRAAASNRSVASGAPVDAVAEDG